MSTLYSCIAYRSESPKKFDSKRTGVGTTPSISSATHLSSLLFVTSSSDLLNELITTTEQTFISTSFIDVNDEQTNRSNNNMSTRPSGRPQKRG